MMSALPARVNPRARDGGRWVHDKLIGQRELLATRIVRDGDVSQPESPPPAATLILSVIFLPSALTTMLPGTIEMPDPKSIVSCPGAKSSRFSFSPNRTIVVVTPSATASRDVLVSTGPFEGAAKVATWSPETGVRPPPDDPPAPSDVDAHRHDLAALDEPGRHRGREPEIGILAEPAVDGSDRLEGEAPAARAAQFERRAADLQPIAHQTSTRRATRQRSARRTV